MDSVELLVKAYGAEFDGYLDATSRKIEETRARRAQLDARLAGARERGSEKGTARTRQLRRHLAAVRAQRRVAEDRNAQLLKQVDQLLVRITDDRSFQQLQEEKLIYLKRRYWAFVSQVYPSWRKQCESKERQEVARLEQELENLNQQVAEENLETATRMALHDTIFRTKRELEARRLQIAADTARLAAQYDEEAGISRRQSESRREEHTGRRSSAVHELSASVARQSTAHSVPWPSRSPNTTLPQILGSSSLTSSSQGSLSPKSRAGIAQIDAIKTRKHEKFAGRPRAEGASDQKSAGRPAPVPIKSSRLLTTPDRVKERLDAVAGRDERTQDVDDQPDSGDGPANESRNNSPKSSSAATNMDCEAFLCKQSPIAPPKPSTKQQEKDEDRAAEKQPKQKGRTAEQQAKEEERNVEKQTTDEERREIKGKDASQGEDEDSKPFPPASVDSVSSLDVSALSLSDTQDTPAHAKSEFAQKQDAAIGLRPLATDPRKMSVVAEENEEGSVERLYQPAAPEAKENYDSFSLSDVSSFSAS